MTKSFMPQISAINRNFVTSVWLRNDGIIINRFKPFQNTISKIFHNITLFTSKINMKVKITNLTYAN